MVSLALFLSRPAAEFGLIFGGHRQSPSATEECCACGSVERGIGELEGPLICAGLRGRSNRLGPYMIRPVSLKLDQLCAVPIPPSFWAYQACL